MIKHIVMFKFLESANGKTRAENAGIAASMLENLQGKIPSLLSSEVKLGYDSANYDLVLIAEFADKEGLHDYIVHPLHKEVGAFMRPVRESRACVDFEE